MKTNSGRTAQIPTTNHQLSIPLVVLATGIFLAGVISGGATFLNRSPIRENHVPGTEAWWPHVLLALITVAILIVVERRRTVPRSVLLLAPLRKAAAQRVWYTARSIARHPTAALRLLAAVPPAALLLYSPFRIGVQVLGGLDPNFTVNAWGGPSYLGAMACHYLDGALLAAAVTWLLGQLLLREN